MPQYSLNSTLLPNNVLTSDMDFDAILSPIPEENRICYDTVSGNPSHFIRTINMPTHGYETDIMFNWHNRMYFDSIICELPSNFISGNTMNNDVSSLTLPSTITIIHSNAIESCQNLTTIYYNANMADWNNITLENDWYNDTPLARIICNDGVIEMDPPLQDNQIRYTTNNSQTITLNETIEHLPTGVTYTNVYTNGYGLITFSQTINTIPSALFMDNTNLLTMEFPSSITTINSYAFVDCTSLVDIPNLSNITSIGEYCFNGCTSLTNISINLSQLTSTSPNHLFDSCTGLTSATIYSSIIPEGMFDGCTSLQTVTIHPTNLFEICYHAFNNCTSLSTVNIIRTTTTELSSIIFHTEAFVNCRNLYYINTDFNGSELENMVLQSYWYYNSFIKAFKWNIIDEETYDTWDVQTIYSYNTTDNQILPLPTSTSYTNTYSTPQSAEEYGGSIIFYTYNVRPTDGFFSGYTTLKEITLHNAPSITEDEFSNCTNLERVIVEDRLSIIYDNAFKNCFNLNYVNIPPTITQISHYAFKNCGNLSAIYCPMEADEWNSISISDLAFVGSNITEHQYYHTEQGLIHIPLPNKLVYRASRRYNIQVELPEGYQHTYLSRTGVITFPQNPMTIVPYGFINGSFTELYLPPTITTLNVYATVPSSVSLTEFTLPKSLTTLHKYALYGQTQLATIYYNGTTEQLISNVTFYEDCFHNVLATSITCCNGTVNLADLTYLAEEPTTITYKASNNSTIQINAVPEGVTYTNVYENGYGLITFSQWLFELVNNMFANNTNLVSMSFTSEVTTFRELAFSGCTNLARINYVGTMSQLTSNCTFYEHCFDGIAATYIICTDGNVNLSDLTYTPVPSQDE